MEFSLSGMWWLAITIGATFGVIGFYFLFFRNAVKYLSIKDLCSLLKEQGFKVVDHQVINDQGRSYPFYKLRSSKLEIKYYFDNSNPFEVLEEIQTYYKGYFVPTITMRNGKITSHEDDAQSVIAALDVHRLVVEECGIDIDTYLTS